MPNRYVREGIIGSEPVNSLSWQTEVFYRRLINKVDDFGRYTAHPALLLAALFPLQLEKVSTKDIERMLQDCERVGLLFTYTAKGKRFLVMNKWEQGRAKTSEYPQPPEDVCKRMQTYVYTCKQMSANAPDSDSVSDPDSDSHSGSAPKSIERAANAERPDLKEVLFEAQRMGLAEWKARDWFNEMEGCGWLDHVHRPIVAWRAVLARVKVKWEADGRPAQPPSRVQPPSGTAPTVWQLTKQLEVLEAQIAELRNTGGYEDAMGWHASNDQVRQQMKQLRQRKRDLQTQLAQLNK
jgi:hypothetical protein